MYVVICDNGVVTDKSLKGINKKMEGLIEAHEFVSLGNDNIVYLSNQDIEFVQDKKRLSLIPIKNLYKKDSTPFIIQVVTLVIAFLILVSK